MGCCYLKCTQGHISNYMESIFATVKYLIMHPLFSYSSKNCGFVQLRVHCASVLKCPIVGDYKYGSWASENWKVGNSGQAPNVDDDESLVENLDEEGSARKVKTSILDKFHPQFGQKQVKRNPSVPKGGRIKGSLASMEPQLHLHCRKLGFPNMEVDMEDGENIRYNDVSKLCKSVEAPLALHMAATWRMLGFNTQEES